MQIVWFKRDLRIKDNTALIEATKHGAVLPLYILEPELWQQPDMSCRQYQFLCESLEELKLETEKLGQSLVIRVGEALEVLQDLHDKNTISAIWSHQETWNGWVYKRNLCVKKWIQEKNIIWHELPQNGVIRNLITRNGWSEKWRKRMNQPIVDSPKKLKKIHIKSHIIPEAEKLGLSDGKCYQRQKGGRPEALKLLNSFLSDRGEGYTKEMSSPVTAYESCSRLSPHIAFGTISMREIFYATQTTLNQFTDLKREQKGKWPSAMRSFLGRLRWHCHFIQKLEDDPRIEFENMHSAYNGLREKDFNTDYFTAWQKGNTGYPMIDACMRALIVTGWLNFRMRAMLMSFSSYHLWLHWREPAIYLAKLFTDYEPGIHYSQTQMQSGTTGINSVRIYNPTKQAIDQDPKGIFIRKWIPELANISQENIYTPWQEPDKMKGYPMPIIDEKIARKNAANKIYNIRKKNYHKEEASIIYDKHGSRKSNSKKNCKRIKKREKLSV